MFRTLAILASLAAVLGEKVVLEAANEDMAAQATIVREGFVYPGGEVGYGGSKYTYSAKTPTVQLEGYYPPQFISLEDDTPYYQPPPPPPPQPKYIALEDLGGESLRKSLFEEGRRQLNNAQFQKARGNNGQEFEESQKGFRKGLNALKNARGESGSFSDEEGGRRRAEDQKQYFGGRRYNQEGQNGAERRANKGHRRGHVVRGFKKSHHSDETGRDEQFYDENHDEGGNVEFSGERGGFGENEGSSYRGGQENGQFRGNQARQQGYFDTEQLLDNNQGGDQHFDNKRFGSSGSSFGSSSGSDEQSLLGHQQSKQFFKNAPKHVPFYPSY